MKPKRQEPVVDPLPMRRPQSRCDSDLKSAIEVAFGQNPCYSLFVAAQSFVDGSGAVIGRVTRVGRTLASHTETNRRVD